MFKRLLDPNKTVEVTVKRLRNGWYVWLARDAETSKHVATGTLSRTAAEAQESAEAYMKVRGE